MFSRVKGPSAIWGLLIGILAVLIVIQAGWLMHFPIFVSLLGLGLIFTQGVFPFVQNVMHEARSTRGTNFSRAILRTLSFGAGMLVVGIAIALLAAWSARFALRIGLVDFRGIRLVGAVIVAFAYISTLQGIGLIREVKYSTRQKLSFGRDQIARAFTAGTQAFLDRRSSWPFVLWSFALAMNKIYAPIIAIKFFALPAFGVTVMILALVLLSRLYILQDVALKYAAMVPAMQRVYSWTLLVLIVPTIGSAIAGGYFMIPITRTITLVLYCIPIFWIWIKSIDEITSRSSRMTTKDWSDAVNATTMLFLAYAALYWLSMNV